MSEELEKPIQLMTSNLKNADYRNIREIMVEFDSTDSVILNDMKIFGSDFEQPEDFKCFAMNSKKLTEKMSMMEEKMKERPSVDTEFRSNIDFIKRQSQKLKESSWSNSFSYRAIDRPSGFSLYMDRLLEYEKHTKSVAKIQKMSAVTAKKSEKIRETSVGDIMLELDDGDSKKFVHCQGAISDFKVTDVDLENLQIFELTSTDLTETLEKREKYVKTSKVTWDGFLDEKRFEDLCKKCIEELDQPGESTSEDSGTTESVFDTSDTDSDGVEYRLRDGSFAEYSSEIEWTKFGESEDSEDSEDSKNFKNLAVFKETQV